MINRHELKLDSKRIMKEGKWKLLRCVFFFLALTAIIGMLTGQLTGITAFTNRISNDWEEDLNELSRRYTEEEMLENADEYLEEAVDILAGYFPKVSTAAVFIAALLSVMSNIFSAGFDWWCLLNVRRKENDQRNMFDGFGFAFKLLFLLLITNFIVTMGLFFFIIPGFYFSLCFSQATYIMFEDPSKGVFRCLAESNRMMKGRKAEYLVLLLSFIGWVYIGQLVSTLISTLFIGLGLVSLTAISSIFFNLWLTPYMGLTRAGFYNKISGCTASGEVQPVQEDNTL